MQKFLAPNDVHKFQNCACLFPLHPASLFLDSYKLICCLWAHGKEKGPRERARNWARNGSEAEEIYQTKRKGKTCLYTWNKVCFHLCEEQEPCSSPSCGWTWKMLHQGGGGRDVPWVKVSRSWITHPVCSMSLMWVTEYKAPPSIKLMLKLLRTTLGSGFFLPNSDPILHFATGLRGDGGCFWQHEARKRQKGHQTLGNS